MATDDWDVPIQMEWDGNVYGYITIPAEVKKLLEKPYAIFDIGISYIQHDDGTKELIGASLINNYGKENNNG